MHPFRTDPFGDFDRRFEQTRQEMQHRHRWFRRLALIWLVFVMAAIGFGCWCVYHVLKARGLVP